MSDHAIFVRDIQAVLRYHGLLGIESYPGGENIEKFLRARLVTPVLEEIPKAQPASMQPPFPGPCSSRQTSSPPVAGTTEQKNAILEELAAEVQRCSRCGLSQQRIVPVAGSGQARVRVAIVGDWLRVENPNNLVSNTLFGIEQDRMLGKMMSAIKVKPQEAFITNVIKCGIGRSVQPQAEHVRACFSYLQRQLMALEPEVIFAMGVIAAKSLLNRSESLSRLRGRLHSYQLGEGKRIPLIATYHPAYLLQNPEMKRATWLDLQMLARQLGIKLQ